jgi:hypothetical protein
MPQVAAMTGVLPPAAVSATLFMMGCDSLERLGQGRVWVSQGNGHDQQLSIDEVAYWTAC